MPKQKTITGTSVCLLGDSRIGKSALLQRLCGKPYSDGYEQTVICHFEQYFNDKDRKLCTLNFYDFMGNRSYDEIRGEFYPLMNAVIYCYDVTSLASFESLEFWRREAETQLKKEVIVFVVGLKVDQSSS